MNKDTNLPPKAISTDNELIVDLKEYVKNPVLFTQVSGNFNLMQLKIIESIIYQLQDHINDRLSKRSLGPLFANLDDEDLPGVQNGDLLTFQIPLKSLCVPRQKYAELDLACEALMAMKNTFYEYDQEQHQEVKVTRNIFHEVRVPTSNVTALGEKPSFAGGTRRKGYIEIKMVKECASEILSLRKGYTEHLFGVPRICHSARTPRLYTYLSAWKDKGERLFSYNELKEWFGVLKYNARRTEIEYNRYPKYADFRRYCLEPAYKEMKKLAEDSRIDYYFEYEPVYTGTSKRGNPASILFRIFNGPRGDVYTKQKRIDALYSSLITSWNIQPEDWAIISEYLEHLPLSEVESRIEDIKTQLRINPPENVRAYAMKVLTCWGTQRMKDYRAFLERERLREEQQRMTTQARKRTEGKDSRTEYFEQLRAAKEGNEEMRLLYPNWEFLCEMNKI